MTITAALLAGTLAGCGIAGGVLAEMADPAVITADAPFRGSPAEKFADGAAGIAVPEAEAVGSFSAEDVRSALETSSRLLQAAYLDRQTLLGGKPDAYAALLDPEQRKGFLKDLDHKDPEKDTRGWVNSFAPGTTELVGDVIKVQGRLTPVAAKDADGEPELRVDYEARFVYAVRPAGKQEPIVRVMTYVKAHHLFWRDRPGGKLRNWDGETANAWSAGIRCDSTGAFLQPDFTLQEGGDGPVTDAYDGESAPMKEGECGSVEEI
ncbi:hypothetical protein Plo01_28030 [Planobispora longispora]|uniref:Lipoprotein n=2 Tax=Planobispora longispora TaxID=28887 RepID=A0A8J3RML2_9ACTN|nr:hypothetical protein Plo01_28030 [Planobispora longispora]